MYISPSSLKSLRLAPAALMLALLSACSSKPLLIVDHDATADFSAYRTYRWYDDVFETRAATYRQYNSSDRRIRHYVDRELQQKGFRESSGGQGDFLVNYSISREDKTEVSNIAGYPPAGVHGGATVGTYGAGVNVGYSSGPSVKTYREGTVIIDVIDADEQRVVWRGVAEGKFTKKLSHAEKDSLAAELARDLLADFPPQ